MMRSILRKKGRIGRGGSILILETINTTCSESDESEDSSDSGQVVLMALFFKNFEANFSGFSISKK